MSQRASLGLVDAAGRRPRPGHSHHSGSQSSIWTDRIESIVAGVRHAELELVDIRDVERTIGARKSKLYADAAVGMFPKPINIGGRMSRWPKHEVLAIAALRVSGGDDEAVRALVARLTAARATLVTRIFGWEG